MSDSTRTLFAPLLDFYAASGLDGCSSVRWCSAREHPTFPELKRRIDLELLETRTFASRVLYVRYLGDQLGHEALDGEARKARARRRQATHPAPAPTEANPSTSLKNVRRSAVCSR